uniref:diphthine methyl ester synthase n=1 Tax=Neogobius melanostomus TaxID=47308 RepID=A0A8C6UA07_9GOBI
MVLYVIGLGLGDAQDITVKGLEAVRKSSRVYLEAYTSILTVGKEKLEEFYGKPLLLADRDLVEQGADEILRDADQTDVAFLVVGDPFGATTHIIHNASIMNAIGCCETVSFVFWTESWKPESYFDKICKNRAMGLHTLCLDVNVAPVYYYSLLFQGKKIFEPPRFMTVSQAADQLLQIIQRRRDEGEELGMTEETVCVGVARLGSDDQSICAAPLHELVSCDLGEPLHSLVVTGRLHPLELDMLRMNAQEGALEGVKMLDSSTFTS